MWEGLDPGSLTVGGAAVSAISLTIVSVIKGWLVPRKTVDALIAAKDAQIKECQQNSSAWQANYIAEAKVSSTLLRQNDRLLDGLETTHAVTRALPRAAEHD